MRSSRHTLPVLSTFVWSCQSIFRVELLAVSCALGRVRRPFIYTGSLSVCRIENRIMQQLRQGAAPMLPADNIQICGPFPSCQWLMVSIWIARRSVGSKVTSTTKPSPVLTRFMPGSSHWVDLAAKEALKGHFTFFSPD